MKTVDPTKNLQPLRVVLKKVTRLFRSRPVSPDFQILLLHAMEDNQKIFRTRVMVPDCYEIVLPGDDYDHLKPFLPELREELNETLRSLAMEKKYQFIHGSGRVELSRGRGWSGQVLVRAAFSESGQEDCPEDCPVSEELRNVKPDAWVEPVGQEEQARTDRSVSSGLRRISLQIFGPGDAVRTEQLDIGDYVIGRSSDAAICLDTDDRFISRRHCQLQVTSSVVGLSDLGSSNGTRVNGTKISAITLSPGDVISMGNSRIEVQW